MAVYGLINRITQEWNYQANRTPELFYKTQIYSGARSTKFHHINGHRTI